MSEPETVPPSPGKVSGWAKLRARRHFVPFVVAASVLFALAGAGITWGVVESRKIVVPDLTGNLVSAVEQLVVGSDLRVEADAELPPTNLRAFTLITSQNPTAGARVFPGSVVTFTHELIDTSVPDLEGLTLSEAQRALAAASFVAEASRAQVPMVGADDIGSGVRSTADPKLLAASVEGLGLSGDVDLTGQAFDLEGSVRADDWLVAKSNPPAGSQLRAGSEVELTLYLPLTEMPNVVRMKYSDAVVSLEAAGIVSPMEVMPPTFQGSIPPEFPFDIDELKYSWWGGNESAILTSKLGDQQDWDVVSQTVAAGQIVRYDQTVELGVAWPSAIVPDLAGMSADEAKDALNEVGLSGREISGNGVARSQSYAPGAVLPMGATVEAEIRHEVTFTVTSTARSGLVTWSAPNSFSVEQANGVALPWSKSWLQAAAPSAYERGVITAQMNTWDGSITCEISVDGRVVVSNTSTGAFAVVSCS